MRVAACFLLMSHAAPAREDILLDAPSHGLDSGNKATLELVQRTLASTSPPPSTKISSDKAEHALALMARTRQAGLRLGTTMGSVCASGFGTASDGNIAPSGTISIGKIRRA